MTTALLLGFGLLVLSTSLILLQLKFFHEGDRKKENESDAQAPPASQALPPAQPAPAELRNPRQRAIWKNMEETRILMKSKEEQARELEKQKEHKLLGLSNEEEILFVADRSPLSLWPVALLSLISIAVSTTLSPTTSLLLLAAGLIGLLYLARVNRSTRYYITNFRVLVRTRSVLQRKARWSALHHTAIRRLSVEQSLMQQNIRLEGRAKAVNIKGLSRDRSEMASRILRCLIHTTSA